MEEKKRCFLFFFIALVVTCFILPQPSGAADKTWIGGSGSWFDGTKWNPGGAPLSSDNVFITSSAGNISAGGIYVGRDGNGTVSQSGGNVGISGGLCLVNELPSGALRNNEGTYNLSGGTLSADAQMIGVAGKGKFVQTGGENYAITLHLGSNVADAMAPWIAGQGRYELSNGTLDANYAAIGNWSLGEFIQTGGASRIGTVDLGVGCDGIGSGLYRQSGGSTIFGTLNMGSGSQGIYELSGGAALLAGSVTIGNSSTLGQGEFRQSGGSAIIQALQIGGRMTNSSLFTLSGGGLKATSENIVEWGKFVHTGGTNETSTLTIRNMSPIANQGYHLSGTGALTAGTITVGYNGVFNQTGGTNTVDGVLQLNKTGSTNSEPGQYNLTGGMLKAGTIYNDGTMNITGGTLNAMDLFIGLNGKGTVNQSAGTVALSGNLNMVSNGHDNWLMNNEATYTLSGGSLSSVNQMIGVAGKGTLIQNGGENLTVSLYVGEYEAPSVVTTGKGRYELHSGTLDANYAGIGNWSQGEFIQTGGASRIGTVDVGVGCDAIGLGLYRQSGGSTIFGTLNIGSGSLGLYELSGGAALLAQNVNINTTSTLGTGEFRQSGGSAIIQTLQVGGRWNPALYTLSGGGLKATSESVLESGTFTHTGGTNQTDTLTIRNYNYPLGSGYNLGGTGSLIAGSISIERKGVFNQTGGTNNVSGILRTEAGNSNFSPGQYNLSGGTLTAGTISNRGSFNYSGGNLNGNIVNDGTVTLSGTGTRTVNGSVTNTGTFKVTSTSAVYTGTFTNKGIYISDPSRNTFADLVVGSNGYLQGGAGDAFMIVGNFINNSIAGAFWKTDSSLLQFSGPGEHEFKLAGADLGSRGTGYWRNFAWGTLDITGAILELADGNTDPGGALYVKILLGLILSGDQVTNIEGNGMNIYYDATLAENAYLGGGTFHFADGGDLTPYEGGGQEPVPEPGTIVLLLTGLAGVFRKKIRSIF